MLKVSFIQRLVIFCKDSNYIAAYSELIYKKIKKDIETENYSDDVYTTHGFRDKEHYIETLLKDEIKVDTFNSVNIHFKKKITIKDKTYLILATVKYEVGSSRDLESLYNGILTRMWIKEDV